MPANIEDLFELSSFVHYIFTYYNTLNYKWGEYRKRNDMRICLLVYYKV